MKYLSLFVIIAFVSAAVFSCKVSPKELSLEDFFKIQKEILKTDLTPDSKAKIAEKYGYTLKQYEELDEKVKNDPRLQEKLGEIKLKGGDDNIKNKIKEDIKD